MFLWAIAILLTRRILTHPTSRCAAVDGVVLHPLGPRNGADNKSVKIAYGTNVISPATRVDKNGSSIADAAEAYGIVGRCCMA